MKKETGPSSYPQPCSATHRRNSVDSPQSATKAVELIAQLAVIILGFKRCLDPRSSGTIGHIKDDVHQFHFRLDAATLES